MSGVSAPIAPSPRGVSPNTETGLGLRTHSPLSSAMDDDGAYGRPPLPSSIYAPLAPGFERCTQCGTPGSHWKFNIADERICPPCAARDVEPAMPPAPAPPAASIPLTLTDRDVQMREPGDPPGDPPGDQSFSAGLPRGTGGASRKLGRGPCVSCTIAMSLRWRRDDGGRDMCGRCYDREYRARKKAEQAERVPPDASQPEHRPPTTRQTAPKAQAGAAGPVVNANDVQARTAAHSKANNTKPERSTGTLNAAPSTSGQLLAAAASLRPQAPETNSSAPAAQSASAALAVDSKTAASAAGNIQSQGIEWKLNWHVVTSNGIDGALHTAHAPLPILTRPPVWAPSLAILQNVWPELGTAVHGICTPTAYHDLPVVLLHDSAFRCAWLPSEPGQDTRIILSTTRVCKMNGKATRSHTVPEPTPAPPPAVDEVVCRAAAMQPGEWPPELKLLNRACLSHGAVVALVTRERTPAVFSGTPAECGVAILGVMRVQNIALHLIGGVELVPDRVPIRPQAQLTIRWEIELIWTPAGQDFLHAPLRTARPWWTPPGPDAPRESLASSSAPPDVAPTQPATTAFSIVPPFAALCTQLLPSYLLYPACVDFYLRYRGWSCGSCGRINAQRHLVQRRCISCHVVTLPLNLIEHKDICTVDDLWAAWERKAPVLGALIAERAERFKDGMITYVYACGQQVVSHISTARNLTLMGRPHARFAHVQELIERPESDELHWTYGFAASDTGHWSSASERAQSLRKYAAYYARGYARDATFDPCTLRADVWIAPAPGRAIEPPFTSAARTLVMCFGSDAEACVTFAVTEPDTDVPARTLCVHLVHGDALYIGNANVKVSLMQKGRMTGIVAAKS